MTNTSSKEHIKENKMGSMNIKRLILTMSAPIVVSMMVQSLYNVVDSIFVAQISEEAITAVSMAFPFQQLMMSVGIGTAIGVNSLLARNLGAKQFSQVNKIANNGLLLAFLSFIAFFMMGLLLSDKLITIQTDNQEIIYHGPVYLRICLMGSLGIFTHLMFERLLQATGKTMYTMIAQISGALMNIILDPIMIFGWFGMPAMGLAGAALATVISQYIGALVVAYLCIRKEKDIDIGFRYMKPDFKIIRDIYAVGIPSIIMISISSVTIFSMNQILAKFSITAVALLGIYFKLQSFIFMPVFGLNNGIIPIVAYNYGAGNKERMRETIFLGMRYAVTIMLIGTLIMMVFPDKLLGMFNASDQMMDIGRVAFRIICISFPFAAISIISIGVFQAIGKGTLSMIISIIRQLVVLVPLAYLFSLTGNLSMVWWSVIIAELVAVSICIRNIRKIIN
ncbi:MATE family efflux transporter [Peptostreptococcus stomatis]|uniref:MATE family efflux transporter n=1 Tax=Peptostreptococcus stomatis TaxID=341694 RepID=UPI0026EFA5E7|nr:MATE family efflux transporter [Peptostreptococcus stomatis]